MIYFDFSRQYLPLLFTGEIFFLIVLYFIRFKLVERIRNRDTRIYSIITIVTVNVNVILCAYLEVFPVLVRVVILLFNPSRGSSLILFCSAAIWSLICSHAMTMPRFIASLILFP